MNVTASVTLRFRQEEAPCWAHAVVLLVNICDMCVLGDGVLSND